MHKCRSYGPDILNLWPFYHLTFKCDIDLQTTWTNISNGTSTPHGEQLCQIILKSMYKGRSYGQDKLNLWPLYHLTVKCELDLQPNWTNVSNSTSTPQGEQLCQTILKFMHKCRSYRPDYLYKLSLWPFYHLTLKCDLELQPAWTTVSNGTSTYQGEYLYQIVLKSMHKYKSYGPGKLNL